MIERNYRGGPIVLRCDTCRSEDIDTGERMLLPAILKAERAGWSVRNLGPGHGRCHFGPACVAAKAWERADALRVNIPPSERVR